MTHKELQMMVKQLSNYQVNQIELAAMQYLALKQELTEIKTRQLSVLRRP